MGGFQKMVDMAKSPAEVSKELKSMGSAPASVAPEASVPQYPYGLCITLTDEELDKLGLDEECDGGDMIHLCALALVTSCRSDTVVLANGEKKVTRRVELQITHLATENEDAENTPMSSEARAEKRYAGAGEED